jgi:hypothetical protein
MLSRLHYAGRKDKLVRPDLDIVFEFSADCLEARAAWPAEIHEHSNRKNSLMKTSTVEVGALVSSLSAAGSAAPARGSCQASTMSDVNYVAGSATVHYDETTDLSCRGSCGSASSTAATTAAAS